MAKVSTVRNKRKLTARKVQNIFSLLKGVNSFGKKNCLTITAKYLFATPGPSTFFFLTTVCMIMIFLQASDGGGGYTDPGQQKEGILHFIELKSLFFFNLNREGAGDFWKSQTRTYQFMPGMKLTATNRIFLKKEAF